MDTKTETAILDLAIARGLISSQHLVGTKPASDAEGDRWGTRILELIREGTVAESSLVELEREVRGIPATWGRYSISSLLGQGAMGTVYKAWDPMLRRFVALKVLHGDEPSRVARFLQEARAQARVEDEHVCHVFDVGMVDEKPFIAMQWVDGVTLQKAALEMTLIEKAEALVLAAEGVQAAHGKGLIHRDVKPTNIMVERTEGGVWKPVVLDFGLARDLSAPGLTQTGMAVGTPAYMAPEQASGSPQATDCRTDVYGLGATLYHLLTGAPPFTGASGLEIMMKLLDEEVVSPRKRQPSIPADLDTIVVRCLEKDPARRYGSARALADDLRRFLAGEPIEGRSRISLSRIARKLRKNRIAVGAASLGLLTALATGALAIRSASRDREQARIAADFGEEARYIEELLRNAYRAPLHDIGPERAAAAARLSKLKERIEKAGPLAEAPGGQALGRGLLALGDHEEAARRLSKAWALGLHSKEVAFALGRALGLRYQGALVEAGSIASRELREIRLEEARATLRDPAIQFLERSQGVKTDAPLYVEGLLALYGGRHEEALAKARRAFEQVPWLYEARKLEADAEVAIGGDRAENGDIPGALAAYQRAGEAYGQALAIGRSDPSLHAADAIRLTQVMELDMKRGAPPRPAFEQALVAIGRALVADPGRARSHDDRSRIFWRWGEYQKWRGEDPRPALDEAIKAAQEAARLDPRDGIAYLSSGRAFAKKGEYLSEVGGDPGPSWDMAQESLERAIRSSPGALGARNSLGLLLWRRATHESKRGLDPRRSLDLAVENLRAAAALTPGFSLVWVNLGISYLTKAKYEMRHGLDPEASFQLALEASRKAGSLNPRVSINLSNVAAFRYWMGVFELRRGRDPGPVLVEAVTSAHQAVEIDPKNPFGYANGAGAELLSAEYELKVGADPRPRLARAVSGFEKAISIKPDYVEGWRLLGEANTLLGSYEAGRGADPSPAFRLARKALEKACAIDPKDYESFLRKGELELLEGRFAALRSRPGAPSVERASEDLGKALGLNPRDADVLARLARVHRYRAEWRLVPPDRISAEVQAGLARCAEASSIDPSNGEAEAERGALLLLEARGAKDGTVRDEAAREARVAFRHALELNRLLRMDLEPLAGP